MQDGVVRQCRYLPDGQRVVVEFAFPGEFIGFESGAHDLTAEAVTSAMLVEQLPYEEATPAQVELLARQVRIAREVIVMRSHRSVRSRVAAFLLGLSERELGDGFPFPLPLADIADHLGLSIPTISRVLSSFRQEGIVARARGQAFSIAGSGLLRNLLALDPSPSTAFPLQLRSNS